MGKKKDVGVERRMLVTELPEDNWQTIEIGLKGLTPLLLNPYLIEDKSDYPQDMAESEREKLRYVKRLAFYEMEDGKYGYNVAGLVRCVRSQIAYMGMATKLTPLLDKATIFYASGEGFIELEYKRLVKDIRAVKIGRAMVLRHRPRFEDWGITLKLSYNGTVWQLETLVRIISLAGKNCGIGDYRKWGGYGRFEIDNK